ncbi:MAG: hypothetical protein HUJ58_07190 [Erysipelotrichaceae bacterium]|nr:hypothetical protein [Erysipelotrichaceae bacterium]
MSCNEFVFVNVIKILKKHTLSKQSDEVLLNEMIGILIDEYDFKNKMGNSIYFDKETTSRLMNRKVEFPVCIAESIGIDGIKTVVHNGVADFVNEYINRNSSTQIIKEIKELYEKDICISEDLSKYLNEKATDLIDFLTEVFIETIKYPNKRLLLKKRIWVRGQNEILICSGDILEEAFGKANEKKIYVIPVNSSFDMILSNPEDAKQHVSENSLHGKWLARIRKYYKVDLEQAIQSEIDIRKYEADKKENYPLGTIVVIRMGELYFYLLALSDFDENNMAHASKEDFKNVICKLLEFYDKNGQGYPIYIPLMGTGRSRINLSHKESLCIIKQVLKDNTHMVHGTINLVIYSNDMSKLGKDDLNDL